MAAGLGFKTFAVGEVLTAADTNGYLMQGVLVFASAAARDAAITSPQEGQFAYLKDTNVTTYYTGSAWANLDTTGMTNPMTTTGDMVYSSSGSTPARLGIGSTGNVLTVAGGVPTWAAPAGGGGDNYTLINAGGTALTGATSITISGISGINSLFIFTEGDVAAGATAEFSLQFNNDTGSNYSYNGYKITIPSTVVAEAVQNNTQITLGKNNSLNGYYGLSMKIDGTNATGIKPFEFKSYNGITGASLFAGTGRYKGSSAISSVKITSSSGNFTAGTIYVFGA
jgi:hypothetical protein